ncbi:MAG: hypothetical protein VKN33_04345 [Candidatus Sericytochromatia bacterium]|nr:hypothetical protein [Candidatus Sericytochromatia bacterium]
MLSVMKLRRWAACVAAVSVLMSAGAPVLAQEVETATVVLSGGSVRGAIAPATTWMDVRTGLAIHGGDTVKTGPESYTETVFSSGARAALGENSIVRFIDMDGLALNVRTGRVRLVAPPEGTLNFMAGSLRASASDAEAVIERAGGAWRLAVLAGTVRVSDSGKNPMLIEAGRSVIFASGSPEPRFSVVSRSMAQDLASGFGPEQVSSAAPMPAPAADTPNPWVAAGLSVLLPGLGQVYSGQMPRGLLYLGAEFALLGSGGYGVFVGNRQLALYAGAGLLGLNLISPVDAALSAAPLTAPAASTQDRTVSGLASSSPFGER